MKTTEFLLLASVYNRISVLNKITSAFLKRHIEIDGLNVSESLVRGVSTVVVTARTDEESMRRLSTHLGSVYEVIHVAYYRPEDLVHQELALYKISAPEGDKVLGTLSRRHKGRILERTDRYIIVEKSGDRFQLESLRRTFEQQRVLEGYSRSGNVVLHKDPLENFYEDARLSLAI